MQRTFRRSSVLFLVILAAGLVFAARAKSSRGKPANQHEERANAVNVVRVINTAEYTYRQDHGRFGSWAELYDSGVVSKVKRGVDQWRDLSIAGGPEVIPGHRLDLLVSADGKAYSLSLRDTASHGCGFSLFSDQSGLIYEGKVLDCPKVVDNPE